MGGASVGLIVALVALVAIIGAVAVFFFRRQRQARDPALLERQSVLELRTSWPCPSELLLSSAASAATAHAGGSRRSIACKRGRDACLIYASWDRRRCRVVP